MDRDIQEIKQDTKYSERTQISLSPSMRAHIDKKRRSTDESLSEYIRNAITIRFQSETKSNKKKLEAAKQFFGAGKTTVNPNWNSSEKICNWQRNLRSEKT